MTDDIDDELRELTETSPEIMKAIDDSRKVTMLFRMESEGFGEVFRTAPDRYKEYLEQFKDSNREDRIAEVNRLNGRKLG